MWEPFRKLGEKIQLTVVGTVIGASANACCVKVSFDADHTVFYRLDKNGNVDQINVSQTSTSFSRTHHAQIAGDELFAKPCLGHIAEAERTESAAKGRLEDIAVGVVVKTAAQILSCLAREDACSRVDVNRGQLDSGRCIHCQLARVGVVDERRLTVAGLAVGLHSDVGPR